jgi:hypothetical protein
LASTRRASRRTGRSSLECLTSDGQLTRKFKYGRDTGSDAVTTKPVPFTRKRFGDDVFRNIGRLLPRTGALIGGFDD